jgi:N-acetylglucosamine-6-phosphate deacetylase
MSSLLITDARIATPDGVLDQGWLAVEHGRISALGSGRPPDAVVADPGVDDPVEVIEADRAWLLPGFVDVHVHGALGHETMDASVDGLAAMAAFYASHGVTSFLATTWTGTTDGTLAALDTVARAIDELEPGGARLVGAHMEGPYLNPRRCGAQEASAIRPADRREAGRFLDTGVVRLMTIAPEVPGNLELIDHLVDRGVVVSAGHTDATFDQMREAVAAGVRHVTHTFNAMRPLHHRDPGVVGAAMAIDALTVELIADDVHVHPAAMRALYAARGTGAVVLVTDAIRATGMPPGEYAIGERTVSLADGAVRLPDGALAGSVLTLDVGLRNLQRATGASLGALWPTASHNAARVVGVDDQRGAIAVGLDADLVLVDGAGRAARAGAGGPRAPPAPGPGGRPAPGRPARRRPPAARRPARAVVLVREGPGGRVPEDAGDVLRPHGRARRVAGRHRAWL